MKSVLQPHGNALGSLIAHASLQPQLSHLTRLFVSRSSYEQHRPEDTVLYKIVTEHLQSYLAHVREHHECGLPKYVEQELRSYLKCGIHAHGLLHAKCKSCGRELAVAFSCKRRGACPSCNARRMCGCAAHLVDQVIDSVPLRQWVLSVPFELRLGLAKHPEALYRVGRIFVDEVFRFQREQARRIGIENVRSGAVLFPQRFGGSLNLNVHYHVAVPDGVYTRTSCSDRATFHPFSGPTPSDLEDIAFDVEMRTVRFLKRKGFLVEEPDANESMSSPADRPALDACLEGSLGVGELVRLAPHGGSADVDEAPPFGDKRRRGASSRGFNVHAGVVIGADDREGRERLLRYCARPPFSLKRLSLTEDGQVLYEIKSKDRLGRTHRRMTPIQFLARLCALIPPPRHPLIVFHGVYAPHSSWRQSVIPERHTCRAEAPACRKELDSSAACASGGREPPSSSAGDKQQPTIRTQSPKRENQIPVGTVSCGEQGPDTSCSAQTDSGLQVKYCSSYALRHPSARIDWAELLKRVHDVDALRCDCGGRLAFIELVTDPRAAQALLERPSLPSLSPPLPRARAPDLDHCA